jgi:hypothetical protein
MSRYRALLDQLAPDDPKELDAEECSALLNALDPDVLDEPDREMGASDCRDLLDQLDPDALDGTL